MRMASSFLKELNQGTVVAHLIQRYVRTIPDGVRFNFQFTTGKESDDAMHPSSAWICSRETYAKKKGDYVPNASPDSQMTFLVGHFYHALMQHVLVKHLGIARQEDIEKEVRFNSDSRPLNFWCSDSTGKCYDRPAPWWGRGFIDVAHCDTSDGDYLIDFKTVNGLMFKAPHLPVPLWDKYYAQVQLYLDWEGVDRAVILCFEKDSPHRMKEYRIERDRDFVDAIYKRWDGLAHALLRGEPPECDCSQLSKNPANCVVKDLYV